MRLLIVRHADPDYANNTITEKGHEEARALANRMVGVGLTRVYSSPLGRAQHTAAYTVEATGLEPVTLPWTAELAVDHIVDLDGSRTAAWNVAGEVVRGQGRQTSVANWDELPELAGYPYQERQEQLAQASDAFLSDLGYHRRDGVYEVSRDSRDSTEAVAVFCHAGFGISWLAHLLQLPLSLAWCGFFLAPTSVTTILMEVRSSALAVPRALAIGDTSHIYAEKLPESSRGLRTNSR